MINKYSERMENVRRIVVEEERYNDNGDVEQESTVTFDYTEEGYLLRRNQIPGSETVYIRDTKGRTLIEMNTGHKYGRQYIYGGINDTMIKEIEITCGNPRSVRNVQDTLDEKGNIIHRIFKPKEDWNDNVFEWSARYDERGNQISFYDGFTTTVKRYDDLNRKIEQCDTCEVDGSVRESVTNILYNDNGDIVQKVNIDYVDGKEDGCYQSNWTVISENKIQEQMYTNGKLTRTRNYTYEYYI